MFSTRGCSGRPKLVPSCFLVYRLSSRLVLSSETKRKNHSLFPCYSEQSLAHGKPLFAYFSFFQFQFLFSMSTLLPIRIIEHWQWQNDFWVVKYSFIFTYGITPATKCPCSIMFRHNIIDMRSKYAAIVTVALSTWTNRIQDIERILEVQRMTSIK